MYYAQHSAIAFLGMGLMGSRMALRLIDAGYRVAVWNRTKSSCDPLLQRGAELLNLHNIAHYPVILTCLADDAAMASVYAQIEQFLIPEQVIVDFSSLSVDQTLTLAKSSAEKNVTWIDSPVSGGTLGAEQGNLVIFAGGNAQVIKNLAPLYDVLAQRVTRMGESGTGQATKICNQLIVAANSTLIAEAVALAQHAGVDAALLAPALAGGFADSKPLQILAPRMANQCFEPVQWKVQTLAKDLNNALSLAHKMGVQIPVAQQAHLQLHAHQQQGYAEADLSTVINHIQTES